MAKVLVVDDDRVVLEVVKDLLEEAGHEVVPLSSPQLVATVIEKERPHLMLVDVNMPEVSGDAIVAFVKRFRRRYVQKIVLFSATDEDRLRSLAAELGTDGFIKKGALGAGLLAEIQRFLPAS